MTTAGLAGGSPGEAGRLRITVFDVVGLAAGGLTILGAIAALVWVQPAFAGMFADFGAALPAITELALQPWLPLGLAALALVVVGEGVLRGAGRNGRAVRMSIALILMVAMPTLLLLALYLPIIHWWDEGGAIK